MQIEGLARAIPSWQAILVLCLGLAVTFVAWRDAEQRVSREAEVRFGYQAVQARQLLERHVQDNVALLTGLGGLFDASERLDRDEFRQYLDGFDIAQRYRGVRQVSLARQVRGSERAAFEDRMRQDRSLDTRGQAAFAIHPPGERDQYLVVAYLEPLVGNERALGFDLYSDPARGAMLEYTRDRGRVTASGPVAPVADAANPSVVALRMPLYRRGMPTQSVAQRRAAFTGMLTSLIDVDELIDSYLGMQVGNDFDLVIRDLGYPDLDESAAAAAPGAPRVLFDSGGAAADDGSVRWRRDTTLDVAGRTWQLGFSMPVTQVTGIGGVLPQVVLLGGLLTSALLCWLVLAQLRARRRALQLVENTLTLHAARGLREQLAFIQQLIEAVPQPIFFKDAQGHYLGVNRAWERFFGIAREQFVGKSVFELYPHDRDLAQRHHAKDMELFERAGSQSYEAAIKDAQGKVRNTIYNKATFHGADGNIAGLIGTITDVTSLKDAEAALRASEARFRDLTEMSSDWYWEQDEELRFTQVSSRNRGFNLEASQQLGKRRWETPIEGVSEEQWRAHRALLEARQPFQDFISQRRDMHGQLRTISTNGRPIFDEQGRFLGYRGTGRDITQQRVAEEQIRHMAHHDALTQLPNRVLLQDRIGQAIADATRNTKQFALLFIDLDRFKTINDSLGHTIGDRLLQMVAARLLGCTRAADTVSRVGGDEFVVLVGDLDRPESVRLIAHKVVRALARSIILDGHSLQVTPSIGICVYPADGADVNTLMRNADTAMYHAKQVGRNNYQYFTQAMNDAALARLELESDLRLAIARREFILHYQPQIDLASGAVVGVEALVRWRHPRRGVVAPGEFIEVAEETGLIGPLGEFVLREACAQARRWRELGHAELQVAVNCSARQFQDAAFVGLVQRVLSENALSASRLELEITESVLLSQSEEVNERFRALGQMGVRISLDDFGTGYSSLSYLKSLPIHALKIDRSFVNDIDTDPDDAAIVNAVIAMAHTLGLIVVAEGIETAGQLAFLRTVDCDLGQGYLVSQALSADTFAAWLADWDPHTLSRRVGAPGAT
jgi:diguanylate cyclase (GGDEF)-like protein/PAS domain S-box-containing protein